MCFVFFFLEEESVGCIVARLKLVLLINIKLFLLSHFLQTCQRLNRYTGDGRSSTQNLDGVLDTL